MKPSSPVTSLTLLDQLRQPNQPDAWKRFEQLYTRLLHAWARQQGFQDADVADLTQEVFVKLMKELPRYTRTPNGTFRGWLSRLTANVCHDFRRRKAMRPLPPSDGLSGVNESPAEFEEVEYRKSLVESGLAIIRGEYEARTWAAFEQLMVHNRSVEEVAANSGLTRNAIYIAKSRILTRLRQVIDGLLD